MTIACGVSVEYNINMTYTEKCPSCSTECAMRIKGDEAWAECVCGEYFEVPLWEDVYPE